MQDLTILFVDDDPVTRSLVEKKIKMAEYELETAVNGVEALKILSERGFDVVLTDLMMPGGVDGIGVLEAVKAKYTRTEVILLTAYASVENAVEAMRKGAADYLQKPVNFDELFLRLDKISRLKKLVKDASDLREAMDVTESNAAQTIQALEMSLSTVNGKISEAIHILSQKKVDAGKRIATALEMLSAD